MTDGVITFFTRARTQDENGVWREGPPVAREVLAQIDSVSRDEFFAAGQNGLRPEYRFRVFQAEYQGERECGYDGEMYAIYRTYRVAAGDFRRTARNSPDSDYIELYVTRKVGVHGAEDAG